MTIVFNIKNTGALGTFLIALSSLSFFIIAQEAKLDSTEFNETYSSDVPVSGSSVVGLILTPKDDSKQFVVQLPKQSDMFCFTVTSIDGTYASKNQYTLQTPVKQNDEDSLAAKLEYPTKFKSIINKFDPSSLALLATQGGCEALDEKSVYFPASKGHVDKTGHLQILVSSFRSEVFMRLKSDEHAIKPSCKRIEEGKRTAYDTICEVDLAALTSSQYQASLVFRKAGRNMNNIVFNIALPAFNH